MRVCTKDAIVIEYRIVQFGRKSNRIDARKLADL